MNGPADDIDDNGRSTATDAAWTPTLRSRRPRADSALARCREIYATNIDTLAPQDIKRLMVEHVGISESVANTYFSNIKKELAPDS